MSELRFVCPSCSQSVGCDASHAGENFPCPACAALIRVPVDAAFADAAIPSPAAPAASSSPLGEELGKLLYAEPSSAGADRKSSAPAAGSQSPGATPAGTQSPEKTGGAGGSSSELRCVCPVCQSELRISLDAATTPGSANAQHAAGDSTRHLSFEEREQQIAAGREASLVAAHTSLKPRLDKILGGEENKNAA